MSNRVSKTFLFVLIPASSREELAAESPDYARDVEPLLRKYCAGCHNADEPEGELRLDSYAELAQGGSTRPAAIVAGDGKISRMMRSLRGEIEPQMPPEDETQPTAEEIAVYRALDRCRRERPRRSGLIRRS